MEAAASFIFYEDIETVPLSTFAEVLENTFDGNTEYAILPVENSLEGSVGESYDSLYSTSNATGEIYHRIEHCLIEQKLEQIDTVYSHPQALGQCRKFIEEHNMKTIPAYDTIGSVNIVKELNKENCASIASKASSIYNMPIIAEKAAKQFE